MPDVLSMGEFGSRVRPSPGAPRGEKVARGHMVTEDDCEPGSRVPAEWRHMEIPHRLDEFLKSAERGGRIAADRIEIMRRLAVGQTTVVVHPASVRVDDLYRETAPHLEGETLVVGRRRRNGRDESVPDTDAAIGRLRLDDLAGSPPTDRKVALLVAEGFSREDLGGEPLARLQAWAAELGVGAAVLTEHGERDVLRHLVKQLGLGSADVFFLEFFRPGLMFDVLRVPGDDAKRKLATRLATELQGSGLVFCETTRLARELALDMHEAGVDARLVHGQTRAREKADALSDFSNDRARVLITTETVTLPRGKNDIRFVIHCGLPESLETYYEQVLLAGADGKQARAVMLFDRQDKSPRNMANLLQAPLLTDVLAVRAAVRDFSYDTERATLSHVAEHAGVPLKKARGMLQLLKDAGAVADAGGGYRDVPEVSEDEVADALSSFRVRREHEHRQVKEVLNFAESRLCRNKVLHRYFGLEDVPACGLCDNCRRGTEKKVRLKAQRRREAATHEAPGAAAGGGGGASQWGRGDLVVHDKWGEGEVKQVWGDKLRIHFPGSGEKVIRADFVHPAR